MEKTIVHYFPGGNTSLGFYSFYHNVLPQKKAKRIFTIKGGPGTGKSSFMKKVGEHFYNKGYDIEYHHCSSDNNSIDGVLIKQLNVALFDGTAPHIIDPINPGIIDEIIHLGDFWDEEGLKKYHSQIIETNPKVGKSFKRVYNYLKAAKHLHDDWIMFNQKYKDDVLINKVKEEIKNHLFTYNDFSKLGEKRELFISAFTPNGIVTYIDSLIQLTDKVFVLKGGPGLGKSEILSFITEEAIKRGYNTTILHDPLTVNRIEHIYIPELKAIIVTENEITKKKFESSFVYDLEINKNNKEIERTIELFYLLIEEGIKHLVNSKKLHDELENYYVPNMKFDLIKNKTDEVIKKIESYEQGT